MRTGGAGLSIDSPAPLCLPNRKPLTMPGKHRRIAEPEVPHAVQIIMALAAATVGVTAALAQIVVQTTAQLLILSRDPHYLAGPLHKVIDHEPFPELAAARHDHRTGRTAPRDLAPEHLPL